MIPQARRPAGDERNASLLAEGRQGGLHGESRARLRRVGRGRIF